MVQGLTEFLPVSSSGHLVIFQKLFDLKEVSLAYDVLLHLGSVLAILIFLRKEILNLILNFKKNLNLIVLIIIASFPAGFIGIIFKKRFESFFNSLLAVGFFYLITAGLLFSTKFIKDKKKKSLKEINFFNALVIGFSQALAILPGVSRSGATIVGGLWQGLSAEAAFNFSFLLSIPAILGATLLEIPEMLQTENNLFSSFVGIMISVLTSYVSLRILQRVLKSKKLDLFGWYCLILAVLLIIKVV